MYALFPNKYSDGTETNLLFHEMSLMSPKNKHSVYKHNIGLIIKNVEQVRFEIKPQFYIVRYVIVNKITTFSIFIPELEL